MEEKLKLLEYLLEGQAKIVHKMSVNEDPYLHSSEEEEKLQLAYNYYATKIETSKQECGLS